MFAVVLDACALYPLYLRDTLLRLAERGLYGVRWSDAILDELRRALIGRGFDEQSIGRTVAQMTAAFPAASVVGYEPLIDSMTCESGDRHVLAAAVHAKAGAIVTFNDADFPQSSTHRYGIQVMRPDDFLLDLLDLSSAAVLDELEMQAAAYQREPMELEGLLDALRRAQAPHFADAVRHQATCSA